MRRLPSTVSHTSYRRLPFVAERPDESLALLAAAYGWDVEKSLPLAARPDVITLAAADRARLAAAEPYDAVLHGTASNALNAWVAQRGKAMGTAVASLRRRKAAWRRGCAGPAARTVPGPPPDICGWFADDAAWRAPRCHGGLWATWCAANQWTN
jgi:hypothetical protein